MFSTVFWHLGSLIYPSRLFILWDTLQHFSQAQDVLWTMWSLFGQIVTLQFTKRTLCDPSRPSVFLVSPESQLFVQDRKRPSPMPRPSRQNLPSLPKQPVSFTMLFERKIGFLKRELFVKHHHTIVTYLHLRKKPIWVDQPTEKDINRKMWF